MWKNDKMKRRLSVGVILAGAVLTPCAPPGLRIIRGNEVLSMGEEMIRDRQLGGTDSGDRSRVFGSGTQDSQFGHDRGGCRICAVERPVLTLAAGGLASRIHGFMDFRINTAYITPRGLTVTNTGHSQFQPLGGHGV